MEAQLIKAAKDGDAEEVKRLLGKKNPKLKGNKFINTGALHEACKKDHDEVVKVLLAHPDIDVNLEIDHQTPLMISSYWPNPKCAALLLDDYRVEVNLPDGEDHNPVYHAGRSGSIKVLELMIASGRFLDLKVESEREHEYPMDAISGVWEYCEADAVRLLKKFRKDPGGTTTELRKKLRCLHRNPADAFAAVVFLSDGYLRLKSRTGKTGIQAKTFFKIAQRLPMELQMLLCQRVYSSKKTSIPTKDTEAALMSLAQRLEPPEYGS